LVPARFRNDPDTEDRFVSSVMKNVKPDEARIKRVFSHGDFEQLFLNKINPARPHTESDRVNPAARPGRTVDELGLRSLHL